MNKIIFYILTLINISIHANEYHKTLMFEKDIHINDKLHSLVFYELKAQMKPVFIKAELMLGQNKVGYVKFIQNIINTEINILYIKEEFRNQKYAFYLLQYICDYLFNKGVKVISLIPVPFEEIDGEMIFLNGPQEDEKIIILQNFYKKLGFEFLGNCKMFKLLKTEGY